MQSLNVYYYYCYGTFVKNVVITVKLFVVSC